MEISGPSPPSPTPPLSSASAPSSSLTSTEEIRQEAKHPPLLSDMDEEMLDESEFWECVRKPIKTVEDVLEYWEQRREKGNLSCHHFREWWREKVPKLLSPKSSMDLLSPQSHIDEDKVSELLIKPLERFLAGVMPEKSTGSKPRKEVDPIQVLRQICELNDPPSTCGKLFRFGEPTYSCRDCGHDPTCVLCVNCFKNSEHRMHRYKMSTSSGGGYCDCGDPEAWSSFVHCSVHAAGVAGGDGAEAVDPATKLPPEIQERARHVLFAVMNYAYDMLTTESMLTLPADLTFKANHDGSELDFEMKDAGSTSEPGQEDYVTVVYNDEFHTFDEVIATLPRAVECDRQTAIGFATMIDREGRAIVKCCGFQPCSEVKGFTERITSRRGGKPLKVVIMHSHVVAHQTFVLRLLSWLQSILSASAGFRSIFSRLMLEKRSNAKTSRLEDFFRHDTVLWKQARTLMHHLLVTGMLLDSHETKKSFSEVFTRCYGQLMKDFIADDHEHSFSVTSLSVQLFTVPTLAHHLIGRADVLAILLRTFMSECERKRNDRGKLEFQRNLNPQSFRRSVYILFDLKYLLGTTPEQSPARGWDNDLRKGFLHGASLFIEILSWMQGMDLQVRQVQQHIEFEFEWESAFNLYMRLSPIFSLVLNWCATDRIVLIKTIRMLFKKLFEDIGGSPDLAGSKKVVAIANGQWEAECIDYTVHTKPISIHAPMSRLLAGLSLSLEKFELDLSKSHELDILEKPTFVELLEPSLRSLVLVAQVHAGMWRRNGYAVMDQVRVYQDPRCRKDMLDQDVTMVQLAAALMDPDDFLINLVNKFNLVLWSNREFDCAEDDSIRQTTTIVEEFFYLLIMIVGERYTPGIGQVTSEDTLRREIIHLLCEESMSHSALNKALAEDVNKETGIEKVIDSVAVFKKPTSKSSVSMSVTGKGVYELRPEFYSEYNVFFYHYTKEEQSKSEETQRMRKRARNEPECHPPPPLPPLTKQFSGISNLMKSDVFIFLLSLVLQRADNLKSKCFSENQVHRVLHLIGLSLREEERCKKESPSGEMTFDFTKKATEKFDLLACMERLVGSQRIESHKHLLNWTIRKWQEVAGHQNVTNSFEAASESTADLSVVSESPECNLSKHDVDMMAEKKRVAAERRKKLMEQMQSAQKNFMKENAQLFDDTPGAGIKEPSSSNLEIMDTDVPSVGGSSLGSETASCVCLGPNRLPPVNMSTTFTCILCLLEDELTATGKAFVMAAFVQKSTVLSNRRRCPSESLETSTSMVEDESQKLSSASSLTSSSLSCTPTLIRHPLASLMSTTTTTTNASPPKMSLRSTSKTDSQFPLLPADLHCSPYTSSCGHVMHASCWKNFFDDVVQTDRQRSRNRHPPSFDTEKNEFLCPLCRTISNTVIPLIPQFHLLQPQPIVSQPSFSAVKLTLPAVDKSPTSSTASSASSSTTESADFDASQPIDLSFNEWAEALMIAMKYKKELKPVATSGESNSSSGDKVQLKKVDKPEEDVRSTSFVAEAPTSSKTTPRFYTCPLDQVAQEMEQHQSNHQAFGRLFLDRDAQDLLNFSLSVFDMMNLFSQAIFNIVLDTQPDLKDERIPLVAWHTCAYTIHAAVAQSIDTGKKSIVDVATMSSRQHQCLSALVRFCGIVGTNFGEPKVVRSHSLKLLSTLLEVDTANPSILEFDAFGMLVAMTFSLPSLFNGDRAAPLPSGNIQDAHILRLVFIAHLVQILLTTDQFSCEREMDEDGAMFDCQSEAEDEEDCGLILELLHLVREAVGFTSEADGSEGLRAASVWRDLKAASLPFLRCAALFYHHLTCVSGPPELNHFADDEFDVLARYLSLPTSLTELLSAPHVVTALARKWSNHPNVHIMLKTTPHLVTTYPLKVNGLVSLPHDYSELINSVSGFTCPKSMSDDSRVPAMCLVCGEVICSQSYCCQVTMSDDKNVGACTAHAEICGAGNGIFLRVRECKVVLLSGRNKGCFIQPPFVDQYGETDMGLRRGNPLHLCREKYRKIYQIWLNHSVPEEIAHIMESNHYLINTPWFNL